MPHDVKGQLLQKGDKVKIEFEVVEVYPGAQMCNVQLKQVVGRSDGHEGTYHDHYTCTASTVEKV